MAKITILGAGGFGVSLAIAAFQNGHTVTVWDISQQIVDAILRDGEHKTKLPGVKIPKGIGFTTDPVCMEHSDMVVFVVPSLYIRSVAQRVKPYLDENVILVNASKGLEEKTFLTMSQVIQSEYPDNAVGVITGPSHAEEVGVRMPTGCVSACMDRAAARFVQDAFMNGADSGNVLQSHPADLHQHRPRGLRDRRGIEEYHCTGGRHLRRAALRRQHQGGSDDTGHSRDHQSGCQNGWQGGNLRRAVRDR